ncbi:MAG: hypothetical protein JW825_00515 [Candidatus Methanofastidiosa archaeon]|nr:hypothetical protein [Candidatus Methanofastidiosa archaeon]
MIFRRHDLVFSKWDEGDLAGLAHKNFKGLIMSGTLPGIVRREESVESPKMSNHYTEEDIVYLGFVYPNKENGSRVRFGTSIDGSRIERCLTPYDVADMEYEERSGPLKALTELRSDFDVGVWGSSSLEIVTGYHYTNETSDLDAICEYHDSLEVEELHSKVTELEGDIGIRIDVEITIPTGYGINLKEYAQGGKTLLAKGLRDVILINRNAFGKLHDPL